MEDFDVAIVGMGPVGAAAAILFAESGLSVVAFERDREVYPLPRAVGMSSEVVRAFQQIGRSEEFASLLQSYRPTARAGFANSKREWLFGQALPSFGPDGWAPMSWFDQPEVDTYLRTTAAQHPRISVYLGHEVEGFEDLGNSVEVHARNLETNRVQDTNAKILVACDGAASPIRKALGITWRDLGYDHDWLVVDVVVNEKNTLTFDTVQVCDPDRLATYVCTKDPYRRWEFKLKPGETREEMLQPETVRSLIDPWTPPDSYEIRRTAVYQFHAAVADCWRKGRVLLAGDAAHQTPPFLGQGMNTGMRDVINLAWKLPMVMSGVSDEDLLDTYQGERAAHAEDLISWAVALGQLMEHLAASEAAERKGETAPAPPPDLLSSGYGQGREAPPLRGGAILTDQVNENSSTGYLFSQPTVRGRELTEVRLDELLGSGFAVVARHASDLAMNEQSRHLVEKLGIRTVALDALETTQGHFDQLFNYANAAVVRPDRYVFGHTDDQRTLDTLLGELAQHLRLLV